MCPAYRCRFSSALLQLQLSSTAAGSFPSATALCSWSHRPACLSAGCGLAVVHVLLGLASFWVVRMGQWMRMGCCTPYPNRVAG